MHVTTVHEPFDPRIFHKQLRSLHAAGFDAHLVAPHACTERADGITIHALPRPSNRAERLALQPQAYRIARALRADVYQVHDPELLPLAVRLRHATGAPVVYDMHENYRTKGTVSGRLLRAVERWAFPRLDHVLLAERSYAHVMQGHAAPHTYIANYFTPIGDDAPGEVAMPDAGPSRLVYTGTLADSRGLQTMVDLGAAIQAQGRGKTIRLVGICHHPDQRARADRQIRAAGLQDTVERVGWNRYVQPTAMPPHYRWADVGLALFAPHPNHTGSLLTKFYEYLHYGLPILASDFPLWRRFIARHDCGAVVPPGDVHAALDVLDSWHERPERFRELAANARAAASEYRWDAMAERLVAVYRGLLHDAN